MFAFTTRQLEILFAIADAGSFRLAAERLNITQASVSNHICNLEFQLGYSLFNRRRGTTSQLTPAGVAFLDKATQFAAFGKEFGKVRQEPPAIIRAFVGEHVLNDFVRPQLADFTRRHPDIVLRLLPEEERDSIPGLAANNKLDCALFSGPVSMPEVKVIGSVRTGIYATEKHVERARMSGVQNIPFIMLNSSPGAKTANADRGFPIKIVAAQVQQFEVAIQLACQGVGAVWGLESMVRIHDRNRRLKLLQYTGEIAQNLYISSRLAPSTAKALRNFLSRAAASQRGSPEPAGPTLHSQTPDQLRGLPSP